MVKDPLNNSAFPARRQKKRIFQKNENILQMNGTSYGYLAFTVLAGTKKCPSFVFVTFDKRTY
jgi:hypothetical protein